MRFAKLPVYKFDELSERTRSKLISDETEFYFDYMWLDDVELWLHDREDSPIHESGFDYETTKDLSIDVSCCQGAHFCFVNLLFDKDIILEKSHAVQILKDAADPERFDAIIMDGDLEAFVDNLNILFEKPSWNSCGNYSGHFIVELADDNDGMYDNDSVDMLLKSVAEMLDEYLHEVQCRTYKYLDDLTQEASDSDVIAESIKEHDNWYDGHGNVVDESDLVE